MRAQPSPYPAPAGAASMTAPAKSTSFRFGFSAFSPFYYPYSPYTLAVQPVYSTYYPWQGYGAWWCQYPWWYQSLYARYGATWPYQWGPAHVVAAGDATTPQSVGAAVTLPTWVWFVAAGVAAFAGYKFYERHYAHKARMSGRRRRQLGG